MELVPFEATPPATIPALTEEIRQLVGTASIPVEAFEEIAEMLRSTAASKTEGLATNTRLSYLFHWNRFARWCAETLSVPLGGAERIDTGRTHEVSNRWVKQGDPIYEFTLPVPVHPRLPEMYFDAWTKSDSPPTYTSISTAWAAIQWMHKLQNAPVEVTPTFKELLRGLAKRLGKGGRRKRQAKPLRLEVLRPLCQMLLEPTRTQTRDRVIVVLRAEGMTWGTMVDAAYDDIVEITDSHVILNSVRGPLILHATGGPACPAAALTAWTEVRGTRPGRLLLRVSSSDQLGDVDEPISRQTPGAIIRRLARAADITIARGTPLSPADADALATATLAPGAKEVRDRAILLVLFAAGLRADELVSHRYMSGDGTIGEMVGAGLRLSDVTITDEGMALYIRSSKTDQTGKGDERYVPRGSGGPTDPVAAMEAWLSLLRAEGARPDHFIGSAVDRHGNIVLFEDEEHVANPIIYGAVTDLLRDRLLQLGMDPAEVELYSSHSCKRGVATEIADNGGSVFDIVEVTHHASIKTAAIYVDRQRKLKDSPIRVLNL